MKGVAGFVCMLLCGAGVVFAGEKTVFHCDFDGNDVPRGSQQRKAKCGDGVGDNEELWGSRQYGGEQRPPASSDRESMYVAEFAPTAGPNPPGC